MCGTVEAQQDLTFLFLIGRTSINNTDTIFWAEIVAHNRNDPPYKEAECRERGKLAVSLLDFQTDNADFELQVSKRA